MQSGEVIHGNARVEEKVSAELKYSPFIIVTLVLMAVALVYVWSHIRMTELEYMVAEEMSIKENLLEAQRKLKVEIATLKSPQRIEAIAKDKLHMSYPTRDQVIILTTEDDTAKSN
ncbi:MAG TPA: cell division protein FtsL [Syntrophaceae bacterium]|jgi:cell division protein FtsL|nr:cell division protein FtsL [Syntrophaceae bacterium]